MKEERGTRLALVGKGWKGFGLWWFGQSMVFCWSVYPGCPWTCAQGSSPEIPPKQLMSRHSTAAEDPRSLVSMQVTKQ